MNRDKIIKLFAENLRIERARKNISQEKLAEMANITPEYLSRIEAGKFSPSLVVIANLAKALSVSANTLIPVEKIQSVGCISMHRILVH